MVFQRPNPFPLSIRDNVAFGFRLHASQGKKDRQREAELHEPLRLLRGLGVGQVHPDHRLEDLLDTSRLYDLLDELADMGTLYLTLTGGEALLGSVSGVDTFLAAVITAGGLILAAGAVILVRFLNRYPVVDLEG